MMMMIKLCNPQSQLLNNKIRIHHSKTTTKVIMEITIKAIMETIIMKEMVHHYLD
jgi:hypothetical protein